MDLGLAGRAALVCGSSSGLGYAIAGQLVAEGCAVAVNGRTEARVREAAARIGGTPVPGDVVQDAAGVVRRAEAALGGVDILICNAGGPPPGPFDQHEPNTFEQALRLNLLSTVELCRAALPGMRERRFGRIVCLTSVAAIQAESGLMLSSMARAGVLGFAKQLADEVAAEGVTVNSVCPGYIGTERLDEIFEARARREGGTPEEARASIEQRIPVGRVGAPDELAAAVAFLASEPARYITGAVLRVDGGYVRSIV